MHLVSSIWKYAFLLVGCSASRFRPSGLLLPSMGCSGEGPGRRGSQTEPDPQPGRGDTRVLRQVGHCCHSLAVHHVWRVHLYFQGVRFQGCTTAYYFRPQTILLEDLQPVLPRDEHGLLAYILSCRRPRIQPDPGIQLPSSQFDLIIVTMIHL